MLPHLQKLSCCWLGVAILKGSAVSIRWWQLRKAWRRGKMRVIPHTEDFLDVKLPDNPVVVQRVSVLFIPFFDASSSCSLWALIVHSRLGLFLFALWKSTACDLALKLWTASAERGLCAVATETALCLSQFLFSLNKPAKWKQKGVLKRIDSVNGSTEIHFGRQSSTL